MRYFRYPADQPKLSSVNPYRLISVRDQFGAHAQVDNPEVPVRELRTVTIRALLNPGAKEVPAWAASGWSKAKPGINFLVSCIEWVPGTYMQMRGFQRRAGHDFLLVAPRDPEIKARLTGFTMSKGDGSFQAFELEVIAADRGKVAIGAAYALKPINISDIYRWQVAADLKPLTLKE
jgi:hypothetical protein